MDIFEDDSVSRRQLVAKTRLLVDDKPAPGEEHVQFYHVSETSRLDEVISAYRAANPKVTRIQSNPHLRTHKISPGVRRSCPPRGCYPGTTGRSYGHLGLS